MKIHFSKYQAAGNDFVIIDNRSGAHAFSDSQIRQICDRRFGVGADGLMLVGKQAGRDFDLTYYNADGSQSLCGNGCRAAVLFARSLGMVNGKASFNAFDGLHQAEVIPSGLVRLKMNDVAVVERHDNDFFLNTGSPHFVRFVDDVQHHPVYEEGKKIRHSAPFEPGGTNVNFVQVIDPNTIYVRTFERGVEDETLSCGTGIVASALAASFRGFASPVNVRARGGVLSVEFGAGNEDPVGHHGAFTDIFLIGPAKMVFEGDLEL